MEFKGIYTPIVTPFDSGGAIDWVDWARVIEYQIEQGVDALIVGGTTGEFYALTNEERLAQFQRIGGIVRKRLPILGGVNAMRADDCPMFAAAARDAGLDGLLVAAPPYSQPTGRELATHCLNIERASGLPIMLYNYPGRTGANMDIEFLSRVCRNANFQSIKESSGDINRLHLLAREFPHLQLSCGADDQALEFFAWGATSWVCAGGNFMLQEVRAVYEYCVVKKDFTTGRKIMKALLPMMTLLEHSGKFNQCVKYACNVQGLPGGGDPRAPMRPLTKETKREVRDIVLTLKTAVGGILKEAA